MSVERETQKRDPGQTKRLVAPRGMISCLCVHTSQVLEMNSIMKPSQFLFLSNATIDIH